MSYQTFEIIEFLDKIGLSENESKIYLKLLSLGPSTITSIAKTTKIPRTTVFENIERLIDKGLVSKSIRKSNTLIIAENPKKLQLIVDNQKIQTQNKLDRLTDLDKSLKTIITSLNKDQKSPNQYENLDIRLYEGKEPVFNVYKESLEFKDVRSFVNLDKYFLIYPETQQMWEDALEKNKQRHLYSIVVETELSKMIEKEGHPRYHAKYIGDPQSFGGLDIHIYGDTTAIIHLNPRNLYAITIKSKTIALGLNSIHQAFWNSLG